MQADPVSVPVGLGADAFAAVFREAVPQAPYPPQSACMLPVPAQIAHAATGSASILPPQGSDPWATTEPRMPLAVSGLAADTAPDPTQAPTKALHLPPTEPPAPRPADTPPETGTGSGVEPDRDIDVAQTFLAGLPETAVHAATADTGASAPVSGPEAAAAGHGYSLPPGAGLPVPARSAFIADRSHVSGHLSADRRTLFDMPRRVGGTGAPATGHPVAGNPKLPEPEAPHGRAVGGEKPVAPAGTTAADPRAHRSGWSAIADNDQRPIIAQDTPVAPTFGNPSIAPLRSGDPAATGQPAEPAEIGGPAFSDLPTGHTTERTAIRQAAASETTLPLRRSVAAAPAPLVQDHPASGGDGTGGADTRTIEPPVHADIAGSPATLRSEAVTQDKPMRTPAGTPPENRPSVVGIAHAPGVAGPEGGIRYHLGNPAPTVRLSQMPAERDQALVSAAGPNPPVAPDTSATGPTETSLFVRPDQPALPPPVSSDPAGTYILSRGELPPGLGMANIPVPPRLSLRPGHAVAEGTGSPVASPPPTAISVQIAEAAGSARDGQIDLTLSPEELGHVRLHLTTTDTSALVGISAERSDTLDLIRRHLDDLARDFRALGYQDVSFQFSHGDPGGQRSRSGRESPEFAVDEGAAPSTPKRTAEYSPRPEHAARAGSGLDLRV